MKYTFLYLFLILGFISGCKDTVPDGREFPIILTSLPKDIDETGATFHGELITEGKLPATSYGFVWGIKDPMVESSNKIVLDRNPASNSFSIRIDHALAKDVEYTIRAFATSGNVTVYGNTISFISKGSSQNGWMIVNSAVNIGNPIYSCSDNEYGYALSPGSKMNRFDPSTNKFADISDFPYRIYDNDKFSSVVSNNILYFIMNGGRLIKFVDGKWITQAHFSFEYQFFSGYYQSLSANNKIHILSSYESFMYDPNSDTWERKAKLPIEGGYSNAGTTLNGKAYVITSDKDLWEYNPENDQWTRKTQYPGTLGDRLVAFSYKDQLYFGISSVDKVSNQLVDKRLWSYNLTLNKWVTREEFPADHTYGTLFYFFLKDNLYLGMEKNNGLTSNYKLWKYDPSKTHGL